MVDGRDRSCLAKRSTRIGAVESSKYILNKWNVNMYSILSFNQAVLYVIFPMSLHYQNTRTYSRNFQNFLFVTQYTGTGLRVTHARLVTYAQKPVPVFCRAESL